MAYLGTRPANAVLTSEQIADGTITTSDLANNAVTAAKLDGSAVYPGFRNRIINGDMRIDQRKAGASVTPTDTSGGTYIIDRFYARISQASKLSYQRSTVAPAGFTNSFVLTSLSAYTLGASDHFATTQVIEGFNIADLGWGTANAQAITISFWVRSSLTGTFGGHITNQAVNRCFVFSYSINVANTWEYKTITVQGDTSGTWLTDNGAGLYLSFSVGAGSSTTTTTAGSWGSTFFRTVTGQTSLVGTNGATFYITGVSLEKGSVATPFEFRSIGQELALCQRYFETGNQPFFYIASSNVYSSTAYGDVRLAVTKRAAPTITTSSWTYYSANVDAFFTPSIVRQTTDRFGYQAFSLTNWNGWPGTGTWTASAEL